MRIISAQRNVYYYPFTVDAKCEMRIAKESDKSICRNSLRFNKRICISIMPAIRSYFFQILHCNVPLFITLTYRNGMSIRKSMRNKTSNFQIDLFIISLSIESDSNFHTEENNRRSKSFYVYHILVVPISLITIVTH